MVDVNGLPPLPKCFADTDITTLDSLPETEESIEQQNQEKQSIVNGTVNGDHEDQDYTKVNGAISQSDIEEKHPSPYSRLNRALCKLREEMVSIIDCTPTLIDHGKDMCWSA